MEGESAEKNKRKQRGVFQRHDRSCARPAAGCSCSWWIIYFDEKGRKHREKVGPKGLATKVYQKRKNEIAERRFFPEHIGRRDVLLSVMIDDYLKRIEHTHRSYGECKRYGDLLKAALRGRSLREISPGAIERYEARRCR